MKYVNGNLISMAKNGEFDVIVHGCNCFLCMSGGIAKTIKNQIPEAFQVDCETKKGDKSKLGSISFVSNPQSLHATAGRFLTVVNAYTQYKYWVGRDDDPELPLVDYDALRSCFRNIKETFGDTGKKFGIPKIGAGLANGDWSIIEDIIDDEMAGEDVTCVLYD